MVKTRKNRQQSFSDDNTRETPVMPSAPSNLGKANALAAKRNAVVDYVKSILKTFETKLSSENFHRYDNFYESLTTQWSKFEDVQEQIFILNSTLPEASQIETNVSQTEFIELIHHTQETYLSHKPRPVEALNSSGLSEISMQTSKRVQLPKLVLPKFSGKLEDWRSFHSLFAVSIHETTDLAAVQKFQYLLTALSGEALDLVKGLAITEANYTVAWDLLCQRYQCERRHIYHHFWGLLELPELAKVEQIPQLLTKFREHTQALEGLEQHLKEYSSLLTAVIVQKMNKYFRRRFDDYRGADTKFPKLEELVEFLEKECLQVDEGGSSVSKGEKTQPKRNRALVAADKAQKGKNSKKSTPQTSEKSDESRRPKYPCILCKESHYLNECDKYLQKTIKERKAFIQKNDLCQNCLNLHATEECRSRYSCRVCSEKHHQTICTKSSDNRENDQNTKRVMMSANHDSAQARRSLVLLATFLARVSAPAGRTKIIRGLLDLGAQRSIITAKLARDLKLKYEPSTNLITGVSEMVINIKGTTEIDLATLGNDPVVQNCRVDVLDSITAPLPPQRVASEVLSKLNRVDMADPQFDLPGKIDMLCGADLLPFIGMGAPKSLGANLPMALPTVFGIALAGPTPLLETRTPSVHSVTLLCRDCFELDKLMPRHWALEEPKIPKPISDEDRLAEEFFVKNHSRTPQGAYVVKLPIKPDAPKLGDTRSQALKRFLNLEKRLNAHPQVKEQYDAAMQDYLDSGHMVPISERDIPAQNCFLPHHAVIKQQSSTTKCRVVMDGSAKSSTGVSLNDIQLTGPTLQADIRDVVSNFRQHKVVFTCDIKQMFRRIKLHEDDQFFQLVLWRFNSKEPIRVYKLTTVTFGLRSSSFLAIRTTHQHGDNYKEKFPRPAKIIKENAYVDDILAGSDSVSEAKADKRDLIDFMREGDFDLHKFNSNVPELSDTKLDTPVSFDDSEYSSLLGLIWYSIQDCFSYQTVREPKPPTKRGVASTIATIFDPCGWLAPVILTAKTFYQLLWISKVDWDTPLPAHVQLKWEEFVSELPSLSELRIPRYIPGLNRPIQVHAFCDASTKGIAGVVYLRTLTDKQGFNVSLYQARNKVSPLQRVSIPRLELCAAALLADMLPDMLEKLQKRYSISSVHAWSDSTATLGWIQSQPYRLKTFIANRVSKIQTSLPDVKWNYGKSADNPADVPSRGIRPSQIKDIDLWWHGPKWLSEPVETWPSPIQIDLAELESKFKDEFNPNPETVLVTSVDTSINVDLGRFSCWIRAQRVFGYILRFKHNCKNPNSRRCGPLLPSEMAEARVSIVRGVQKQNFAQDLARLSESKPPSRQMLDLNPFIAEDGLIRVGGRIRNARIPAESRHPILLPKKGHATQLIIQFYHLDGLHSGLQLTLARLSQFYWIISARQAIRSVITKCVPCFRARPLNVQPIMSDLPTERVTRARCFEKTGMDFCGGFPVKIHTIRAARTVTCYVCVFVCLSTKAAHLEVVEDLSAIAFRGALTRFASRRGWPTDLYSDNGTNFVGASNQYKKTWIEFLKTHKDDLSNFAATKAMKFHFIAPAAPNQGGLWEACVKSMKSHLKRTLGNSILYLTQFETLIAQIEALLNSRPLTPLSSDPNDLGALTPAHFLIGGPVTGPPEPDWAGQRTTALKHWQQVQEFTEHLWSRWHHEYLQTLQRRLKWNSSDGPNLAKGDLALLHDPSAPPFQWKYCRVLETYPGKDGVVRNVKIKTPTTELVRPVSKLYPLPNSNC